jgi:hypothetical protein
VPEAAFQRLYDKPSVKIVLPVFCALNARRYRIQYHALSLLFM